MVDNQHKKIKGYRDLSEAEIQMMNEIKEREADLKMLLDRVGEAEDMPSDSKRWLALARTNLETGFMYAVKAVARPVGQMGSGD